MQDRGGGPYLLNFRSLKEFISKDRNQLKETDKVDLSSAESVGEILLILAGSTSGIAIFKTILEKNILLTQSDLISSDNNGNTIWHLLAKNTVGIAIIWILLGIEILPTSEVLAKRDKQFNRNTWNALLETTDGIATIRILLCMDILPTSEDLDVCDNTLNMNTWRGLAENDEGLIIIAMLLERDILPTTNSLTTRENNDNLHTWDVLARSNDGIRLIQALLDLDILPHWEGLYDIVNSKYVDPFIQSIKNSNYNNKDLVIKRIMTLGKSANECNINPKGSIAISFSREDKLNFYGFLYLFYLMTARDKPEINLTKDIWFLLGRDLLPPVMTYNNFLELTSEENRSAFVKYHVGHALEVYVRPFIGLRLFDIDFSYNYRKYPEKAESLKKAVSTKQDPGKLLRWQFMMLCDPSREYLNPKAPHEQKYNEKATDPYLEKIVRDGCFLSR
jgi:hypothetical protein